MIALYAATINNEAPHPIQLAELPDTTHVDLHTRYAGTRPYRAGTVSVMADHVRPLLDARYGVHLCLFWIRIGDDYLRVHNIRTGHYGTVVLEVDQSLPAPTTRTSDDGATVLQLRVVEPSPPCPVAEWLPAEAERVIRDHETQLAVAAEIDDVLAGLEDQWKAQQHARRNHGWATCLGDNCPVCAMGIEPRGTDNQ